MNCEHSKQCEVIFDTNIVFLRAIFTVIAPPMVPISMKLCMAVKVNVTHVFTNFHKVSRFCLGFIGLWLCVTRPPF